MATVSTSFAVVCVLGGCTACRFSPENLNPWPSSGNASSQSATGGRSRQTPVWPRRWLPLAFPRPRPIDFPRGKAAGEATGPIRRSGVSSAAARRRLAAVAGGPSRAIRGPTEAASRLASPLARAAHWPRHPPSLRLRRRFTSSTPTLPFRSNDLACVKTAVRPRCGQVVATVPPPGAPPSWRLFGRAGILPAHRGGDGAPAVGVSGVRCFALSRGLEVRPASPR